MMNKHDSTEPEYEGLRPTSDQREIVITRVFNAPRELVFKVWTDPEHVAQWWGPKGFTTTVSEMDFRPGGVWRYVMRDSNGTEYPVKGVFREIVPPERIVTSDDGWDEGNPEGKLNGMIVTVTFEEQGNKTKLTLRIMHKSVAERLKHEEMGVIAGWNSSFDCLEDLLAKV